ncbi:HS12A-like protein [Mya arenaria]|uniref:HS12A-like protein n=1 Tax=Mya arenaria TaxID=6604 RepID=A0ABY7FWQ9_MYAAR|nr:HS12A-like protein [Mya arenaria]
MAAKTQSCLIVAAFDVGTTYSGYAFSYRDDPLKVQTNQVWFSEGAGNFLSLKTPTSVLLNPDGKFDSFGFEAEDRYTNKAEDDKHHGWRLFRRFKMALHNDQAGLDETRVTLAPEPEAASIWCETLDVDTKAALAETGNQYMVIDLEDGTADISFRERKGIGTLKEIHQPTSGPWGGIYVDANYLKFLENIFGEQTITSLKNDEMDYFDFIRDFKTKKRTFSKHAKGKIIFRISANTRDLSKKFTGQNLEQRICSLGYGDSVIVRGGDKLGVEHDIVRTWFDGPIDSLIGHIKSFLKKRKLRAVQTIVLVGGFGGSPYVQDRLRAAFPDKRLILPVEAELAVLKGAAGLDGTRVTLALEPEAASIWCDTLDVDTIAALAGTGTQYMVIDLGEKKQGGTLKEIHQPSGGPWGGIYVDANYLKFLDHIFGEKAITALKTEDMTDYFDVIREFETKKRTFTTQTKGKFMFKISATTRKLSEKFTGQNLEQRLRRLGYGDSVIVKCGDKLRVEPDIVRTWFDGPLNNLVDHVNNLLREAKLRAVQTIVLVGGFGESTYVQERLRAAIPDKRLIVPAEAGLVVLKGAVRFGHNPAIITSRVMKYTYGVAVWSPYDEKIHSADKKILDEDGKWRVRQCFSVFVRVNDNVPIDHQITKEYTPSGYRTATPIYRTTAEKPVYVTDPGCELLGELVTELPRDIPLSELRDDTTFMFGGTELVVKVRVKKTGQEEIIKLNCLK